MAKLCFLTAYGLVISGWLIVEWFIVFNVEHLSTATSFETLGFFGGLFAAFGTALKHRWLSAARGRVP
jgi:hypothetical protein